MIMMMLLMMVMMIIMMMREGVYKSAKSFACVLCVDLA